MHRMKRMDASSIGAHDALVPLQEIPVMIRRAFLALVLASTTLTASAAPPDRDPVAGPLEVIVFDGGEAFRGLFAAINFALENDSADTGVQVHVDEVLVRWADGTTFEVGLDQRRMTLAPMSGAFFFASLIVPDDAPLGPATIRVRAHASRISHATNVSTDPTFPEYEFSGGVGHRAFAGDSHAADEGGFIVRP